ncbi:uncharacterized protein MELLADRAFT_85457 [Melampsora larici-populina 98AG31]|uniref:Uncharacterized protein n=1 Tax=Melampsora larici-populina (strain 98AG31 / pathotype 3-4-7) TaxID=747676 RepID=F4RIS0_MELLP|nr:uncharacterized protein MELLADRAFT_85457 [Melampsora larici-populina 98AG31]EGG07610.1 hypothetical protein MELLADRAFT_85457 [Melampsora larici-populina 98AG31]
MQTWRPEIGFLHALACMICFIPIGGFLINSEGVIELKFIEKSDQNSGALLPQDARNSLTNVIRPGRTDINRRNKKIVKDVLKNDKDFKEGLPSVDGQLSPGGSNSNNMLSAYAPEFGPQKISNPRSVPQTDQRSGSNHPHDLASGVKSNSGDRSRPVQRIAMAGVMVPVFTPSVLELQPLIPVQHIGQQYHNIMEMQPEVLLQHIDKQNKHISSGQKEPSRQSYNHRKSRLSNMSSCDAESDVSLKHQTTDAMAGRFEHDKQAMNLETLPMTKDVRIQQRHQSSVVENMSTRDGKSKKDSISHFEPTSIGLEERTQKDQSPTQFVKFTGSSNIKNKDFHRLQKSLKPVNVRIETLEEKEHHLGLSEPTPLPPVKTRIESHLGSGKIPKIPWNEILDPLKSNSRTENQPLMEAPEEAPRGNHHEYQSSDNVGFNIPETEIRGKTSKGRDDWIIPKKTVKSNQISKINLSQGSDISELPKLQHESSSDPLKPLQPFKELSAKLQKSSKKHKKKNKANSNSNVSRVVDENWDTELLKALKETSVADEKIETEHEKLIKNVQKRLQNIFISQAHRKSDVPSSSSHPWYHTLIEEFVCLDNHTPLLELKLKSETYKRFRRAEKESPMIYNTSFWLNLIDEVLLDTYTWIEPSELLRRKKAFLVQYLLRRDSEIFKEQKHTWSQEGREFATLLRFEDPFEMFLDSTQEEIKVLEQTLEVMKGSDINELSSYPFIDSINIRSIMISLRSHELEKQSPCRFFGKEFLEKACQQGLYIPRFRQFETALELSVPEVTWKGLHEDELDAKYSQVLYVLAGMPTKSPSSPEDTEKYLYSQAEVSWINSHLQQLINSDPEVLKHVTNRFKLLLTALKGKKTRPSHKVLPDLKASLNLKPESNVELISRDEALAATFVGLTLANISRFKTWLTISQNEVQGNRRRFIHWPEALQETEEVVEALKRYYELLGIKLLLKKEVSLMSIKNKK